MMLAALDDELRRWADEGLTPCLWLRDDDAVAATPALERLIALSDRCQAPVLLAVIPRPAQYALAERLVEAALVTPCQHGYAHRNHAAEGERAVELGGQRSLALIGEELAEGRRYMAALFAARLSDILVPPWNRIDTGLLPSLAGLGFTAVSTFGPPRLSPLTGLAELNCHVDLIDWRGGRVGKSLERLEQELVAAFALARLEGGRAVGFLTHHLAHDEGAWRALEMLAGWCHERGLGFAAAEKLIAGQVLSRP